MIPYLVLSDGIVYGTNSRSYLRSVRLHMQDKREVSVQLIPFLGAVMSMYLLTQIIDSYYSVLRNVNIITVTWD